MESLHKLKKMMCRELDEISNKGDMSAGDLEAVHKLTDTIKNIDKIMYLEGGANTAVAATGTRQEDTVAGVILTWITAIIAMPVEASIM